ncbi:MAG TPA: type II toxin-antitoxin system VapC family toxin [Candidatus Acidoferrales bacterium]|nr:type II toxin-antitoxin system VapC family toxin [Candidatus Acidoferrales bacterium]
MNFLLDTSILLWALTQPQRLNRPAHEILGGGRGGLCLSAVSVWEIVVKYQLGKLPLPRPPAQCVPDWLKTGDIQPLDVSQYHALAVADLPMHHQDPFDRMLIAQARTEGMVLLTADRMFEKYDVETIWCGA